MDSMHPDPAPAPPPSLDEIRASITRLEDAHKARGLPLSGRIIHVCHHLPVEIIRVVPQSAIEQGGVLSPPMTPEFKPEDADPHMESVDARWRIHARTAHTAMISGMRSLSDTHENIVVAWTGEVLLQTVSQPTPTQQPTATFSSISDGLLNGNGAGAGDHRVPHDDKPLMVYGGEFTDDEQKELAGELERFQDVEKQAQTDGTLKYVPVFLPPDVSKGHYEGFCKKSELQRSLSMSEADLSPLAPLPLPPLARLDRYGPVAGPALAALPQGQLALCRQGRAGVPTG